MKDNIFKLDRDWYLLSTDIETKESDSVHVWEKHGFNIKGEYYLIFITHDYKTEATKVYEATVDPEKMTDVQRKEVLDYTLGSGNYEDDEIVNYLDLFLHRRYLKEVENIKY